MIPPIPSPLDCSLALICAWALVGFAGLLRPGSAWLATRLLFPLGAACGLTLAVVAALSLPAPPEQAVLPLGLPDLPFHLRLDALSRLFLCLLGAASAGSSIFAAGYFQHHGQDHGEQHGRQDGRQHGGPGEAGPPGLLCLQFHLFLASMGLVLLADDAYTFMVAWEAMALSSYFLVTARHGVEQIRRAGFLYLLMAHVGALSILLSFGVMQGGSWLFTFDAMRAAHLPPNAATAAFLLALAGFGAKAGLVPLHVWLPEAHPAAPSPVSALMSGVMLKTAVYGVLRVTFDLLGATQWWWGLVAMGLGLGSALYGVVFAAVQTDGKRLLAYSSIENLGIIFTAIGLGLTFGASGMPAMGALALTAALYHCLNHACMKSLLFLGTGSVLHATGSSELGRMGGLIHRMPWTAWLTLVGALALAGLPPLNGFVSEWLLLQSFLFAQDIPRAFVSMLLPLGAAVVALSAALAAYVMVKYFGLVFLGKPRRPELARARDAGIPERLGLAWLATTCCALGLLAPQVVAMLGAVVLQLTGQALPDTHAPWWLLAPVQGRQVSYSAPVFLLAIAGSVVLTILAVKRLYHARIRRAPAWDCGSGLADARMQDSAEGFGQPIGHIFRPFFAVRVESPSPFDATPHYSVQHSDRFWRALYLPLESVVQRIADRCARLQRVHISVYLLYSFATLIALLALVLL